MLNIRCMAAISMMFLMVVPVIAAETMCAEPAPDQPLPAIALQEIAAGFARVFRRYEGVSPSIYRNRPTG